MNIQYYTVIIWYIDELLMFKHTPLQLRSIYPIPDCNSLLYIHNLEIQSAYKRRLMFVKLIFYQRIVHSM